MATTTDIPGASVYTSAVELAKKKYQTRLADLNRQRQSTLRTSGFTANIDDKSGLLTNQRIDPFNKYGQIQQLNRSQAMRSEELFGMNTRRGLSSRGGLGAQNMSNMRYDFGKEDADFGANLTDILGGYTRQQEEELFSYNEALWRAQQEAALAAMMSGDYGSGGGYYGDYDRDGAQPTMFSASRLGGLGTQAGVVRGTSSPVRGSIQSQSKKAVKKTLAARTRAGRM